ncbi:MAG: hypothetical protein Q7T34_01650 [Candidatus Parcubacteria bacterium]|nr:hypothetical protein [Candidatus Parcubacteria bacterium]
MPHINKECLEASGMGESLTAPKFFSRLLTKHPEILQVSMVSYLPALHGVASPDIYREYLPALTEISALARGEWRKVLPAEKEIVAIGSTVDVCDIACCDHSLKSHEGTLQDLRERWHNGDPIIAGAQKSFVFLDLETHGRETLEAAEGVLMGKNCDWYILDSGAGFHIVLDKLVGLDDLAGEYGRVISDFGKYLEKPSLEGWGNDLINNGKKARKLEAWCEDALKYCGHGDESVWKEGKEVHMVDLRYVAHRLRSVMKYQQALARCGDIASAPQEIGGAYLRISTKGQDLLPPPVLVAQRVGQSYRRFNNPLESEMQIQKRLF